MKREDMRRKSAIFLAVLAPLLLVACSGEKQQVKNLVTTYNRVLVDAYLKPKPNLMENFTSPREFIQIDTYISYLYKTNRILKCDLKKIDFEDVKIKGDTAVAVTRERWVYVYLDPVNRKPVSEEYDVISANKYSLVKEKGRWVVDELDSREIGGKREG